MKRTLPPALTPPRGRPYRSGLVIVCRDFATAAGLFSNQKRIGAAGADNANTTASPGVSERLPTLKRRARSSSQAGT